MFSKERNTFSAPLIRIATWSIALGLLVMVLSISILRGFQQEIEQKVVGFGSHIVVKGYESANSYEDYPIDASRPELQLLTSVPGVRFSQRFATKGGMVKTDVHIHGILLKGVDNQFDTSFFASNLIEGSLFGFPDSTPSNEVIISKIIAKKMNLHVGDKMRTYFWQGSNYRARAFTITGIYNTDLADFDEHYVIGDLRQVQQLNQWAPNQVAGIELLVDDFAQVGRIANDVASTLPYDLNTYTITQQNPALFAWLDLLNSNIVLILAVMALVCMVAVISALLILAFEKTSAIGLLKALGASNRAIRHIFLYRSSRIVLKGILIGDAIALAIGLLQHKFHFLHLDPESYSMSFVPMDLSLWTFLGVSIFTFAVCMLAILIPASAAARTVPTQNLKVQ